MSTDEVYLISKFREVQTKFGKRIVAQLNDKFLVFLPARIAKLFEEDEKLFEDMKKAVKDGRLGLQYIGGSYNKLEFKNL